MYFDRNEVLLAMKTFLIQTIGGGVVHDFSFGLIEAVKYHDWYYGKDSHYTYILSETTDRPKLNNIQYYPLDSIVPVGTVNFVLEYLRKHYGTHNVKPVNIPRELMKSDYLKRWVKYTLNEVPVVNDGEGVIFVKSATQIKGYTDFIEPSHSYPAGEYIVSEYIPIDSEWRAFVCNGELVGLNSYSGDFTLFPDVNLIKAMISDYKSAPGAYTLDVGVNVKGTFIIECHDFFSCGLYGFSDYTVLPKMFVMGWNHLINRKIGA